MKPILVLCLGNEILSDDAFGFKVSQALCEYGKFDECVEIIYAPLAGFNLLNLLQDRVFVLIVDSIVTKKQKPGTIQYFPMGQLTPTIGLTTSHEINLPTALELAERMGIVVPKNIDVLAVEALDVETISELLTPAVKEAVDPSVRKIIEWTTQKTKEIGINV